MKEFRSFLAPQIRHFIRYRQASQRWNDSSYEENLMLFDRYCLENYPGDTMLTQEMVGGWCRQRHTEANNSCRSRIYVVDSFVRFLNGRGLSPVQPPQIPVRKCGLTSPMPLHRKSSAVSSMSATISPSSTTGKRRS